MNFFLKLARKIFFSNLNSGKTARVILDLFLLVYYYSGFFFYLYYKKILSKPYIGSYLFSDQEAGRERQQEILKILSKIKSRKIDILELGVFCGQTTISIINFLKQKKNSYNYYCVDIWKDYKFSKVVDNIRHKYYLKNLKSGKVFNLFIYNINTLRKNSIKTQKIFIKNMTSEIFFKKNKKKFDLIIVDASHLFKYVNQDIRNSKKVLKKNGILIGDDYELEASEINENELLKLKNFDTFFSKKHKLFFHPGVTLSVKKHFGNLKTRKGLFCVKYLNDKFVDQFK